MIKLFTNLYEWVLGRPMPPAETLNYREVIFPNSGLWMLGLSLAFVLLYYYALNSRSLTATFHYRKWWFLMLLINAVVIGFLTSYLAQKQGVTPHSYITWLACLNAGYGILAFILFSFVLRLWSNANTVPLRFFL